MGSYELNGFDSNKDKKLRKSYAGHNSYEPQKIKELLKTHKDSFEGLQTLMRLSITALIIAGLVYAITNKNKLDNKKNKTELIKNNNLIKNE